MNLVLWALMVVLLGLVGILVLFYLRPPEREPTEVERALPDYWKHSLSLQDKQVTALQSIADSAKTWERRYTRRKRAEVPKP